ncbi:hypothetical protein VFPPC_17367 [Pochonia chlamydosporia 170]|uniref:Uncharacterized protein n=1 Tax=Pochonia chlamydosporia 170 TaxID=1380566 RepID=A0A219AT68_METCM|nr:hypothetical protein VFPPC_17367 [Pochonia chlamydosporia 170]OWT43484.1 hypothetical protein VFPPC_17367 [Pochonia chlamydosporia 170]
MISNIFKTALLLLSLCLMVHAQSGMTVYGCTRANFQGTCQSFTCPYQECCQLPSFFQTSLVSVKSTGPYNFRLFTDAGCALHCNDNDNGSRHVDSAGWGNIGAAAYACIDGPY